MRPTEQGLDDSTKARVLRTDAFERVEKLGFCHGVLHS